MPADITVVIPAYRAEATIRLEVDSACTEAGARVVVMIDGLLDRTPEAGAGYPPHLGTARASDEPRGGDQPQRRPRTARDRIWDVPTPTSSSSASLPRRCGSGACLLEHELVDAGRGSGEALSEYLLCGLPVIGTGAIGDTASVIRQGLLLDDAAGSPTAPRRLVEEVLPRREAYRERARAAGEAQFSLGRSIADYARALAPFRS